MSHHSIKFERNVVLNVYRATCSCGWSTCEPKLQTAQERAAIHELNKSEWEPITPEKGTTE